MSTRKVRYSAAADKCQRVTIGSDHHKMSHSLFVSSGGSMDDCHGEPAYQNNDNDKINIACNFMSYQT
jgi:hypothetical protein